MSVWGRVCECRAVEAERRCGTLELELQAVVICLVKVLGTQFRSSGRIARLLTTEPCLQPLKDLILTSLHSY